MSTPHTIHLALAAGGYVRGEVECAAEEGADCRLGCSRLDHEACDCPREDQGICLVLDWLSSCGPLDCYRGPDTPARSGPIVTRWTGDWHEWMYADDPGADAFAAPAAAEVPA